jgi:phosphoribosylformylglycinamidine synthase
LDQFQILCLPGGFSYGDDIAAGRILAGQIRHHLADAIERFRQAGKLVLGICNGFQVLVKSGILLPELLGKCQATLTWNQVGRFQDRWVRLKVASHKCVFLRPDDELFLPVAHAEGKFVSRDAATLTRLEQQGQLVLRYVDDRGCWATDFPANPNGSEAGVAGVCDETGRVLGLMPHPERHFDPTHHPHWTRLDRLPDHGDGRRIFENAVAYFA